MIEPQCTCGLRGGEHDWWCPCFDIDAEHFSIPAGCDSANAWNRLSHAERRAWLVSRRAEAAFLTPHPRPVREE